MIEAAIERKERARDGRTDGRRRQKQAVRVILSDWDRASERTSQTDRSKKKKRVVMIGHRQAGRPTELLEIEHTIP